MMRYFQEKSYIMRVLIQSLKAIHYLNEKGLYHGDINSSNVIFKFEGMGDDESFRVQLFESLHIKELVEIAMCEQG